MLREIRRQVRKLRRAISDGGRAVRRRVRKLRNDIRDLRRQQVTECSV